MRDELMLEVRNGRKFLVARAPVARVMVSNGMEFDAIIANCGRIEGIASIETDTTEREFFVIFTVDRNCALDLARVIDSAYTLLNQVECSFTPAMFAARLSLPELSVFMDSSRMAAHLS